MYIIKEEFQTTIKLWLRYPIWYLKDKLLVLNNSFFVCMCMCIYISLIALWVNNLPAMPEAQEM